MIRCFSIATPESEMEKTRAQYLLEVKHLFNLFSLILNLLRCKLGFVDFLL